MCVSPIKFKKQKKQIKCSPIYRLTTCLSISVTALVKLDIFWIWKSNTMLNTTDNRPSKEKSNV